MSYGLKQSFGRFVHRTWQRSHEPLGYLEQAIADLDDYKSPVDKWSGIKGIPKKWTLVKRVKGWTYYYDEDMVCRGMVKDWWEQDYFANHKSEWQLANKCVQFQSLFSVL